MIRRGTAMYFMITIDNVGVVIFVYSETNDQLVMKSDQKRTHLLVFYNYNYNFIPMEPRVFYNYNYFPLEPQVIAPASSL